MKVLIVGGHVTPALAVIDDLLQDKQLKINKSDLVFVGRKFSDRRGLQTSFEYQEVVKRDIRFVDLKAGRLTRVLSFRSVLNILQFPYGFFQALQILREERPNAVLSFGGYLALPINLAAILFRKKIFVHEQTIHPGLANRIIAPFARKIFVSFPESARFFPPKKVLITGNPLRTSIFRANQISFPRTGATPVIYITGGSLGAHSINLHIMRIIEDLLRDYVVIHQTGNVKEFNDYQKLQQLRSQMKNDLKKRYILKEHIKDDEIGYVFSIADMVVSRAGANTFFELVALNKPSVLIPLPWSAHKEQQKHAELIQEAGGAEIFNQTQRSQILLELIHSVLQNKSKYKRKLESLQSYIHDDAAKIIIQTIFDQS